MRAQFDGAVQPKTVSFSYDGAQTRMQTQSQTKSLQWQGPLERFGRMRLKSGAQEMDVVVLWVDEGFRTASIGTPDGSFGWIIDRAARGGADRIKAAGEILAFNGYDVTRPERDAVMAGFDKTKEDKMTNVAAVIGRWCYWWRLGCTVFVEWLGRARL